MSNQKKRTAWSVQDVVSGRATPPSESGSRFKSGYSGPKKSSSVVMDRMNAETGRSGHSGNNTQKATRSRQEHVGRTPRYSGGRSTRSRGSNSLAMLGGSGIMDYAWVVYCFLLALCLAITLIIYNSNGGRVKGTYSYPSYIFSVNGVINAIYEDYADGGLGSRYNQEQIANAGNAEADASLLGGTSNSSTLPNTTTGSTMSLDTGSTYGEFSIAGSHDELITQLDTALQANDFGFVGMKLAYEDEETGDLIGYPQSVVENFTQYMSENSAKREAFLNEIKNEETYGVKNGQAYLVKLPILKFTINMGYDNTTISMTGFSDIEMNAGQSATVSPLLPCMYTITVSTNGASQSQEVEADLNEGNLQVNIGVSNESGLYPDFFDKRRKYYVKNELGKSYES